MKAIEILIVTRSVVLQQGLGALIESLPEVASVKAVKDLSSAYAWIEEHQPQMVFLDEDMPGKNTKASLEKIRSLSPDTQRALLANDIQEVNLLLTHAEVVLIKGASPCVISTIITNLLSTKGEKNEPNDDSN